MRFKAGSPEKLADEIKLILPLFKDGVNLKPQKIRHYKYDSLYYLPLLLAHIICQPCSK